MGERTQWTAARERQGRQGGPSRGSRRLASQQEPNVEFVPSPARVPVGRAVEGSTPAFVMNCRSRLVHRPEARCGWPYGVAAVLPPRRYAAGTETLPALLHIRDRRRRRARAGRLIIQPAGGRRTPIREPGRRAGTAGGEGVS